MGFGRNLKGAAILTAVAPPVIGAKVFLWHRFKENRALKQKQLRSNRLVFSKLPRERQRAALYYKRAQLRDVENIYKAGYKPKPRYRQY